MTWFPIVLSLLMPAPQAPASCQVEASSVLSHSSSGIDQVSNLALMHFQAHVPARPSPGSPARSPLRVEVSVEQMGPGGAGQRVPSTVNQSGGGGDATSEQVNFMVAIPIDPAERDAAIRVYLAAIGLASPGAEQAFANLFLQHRVGHFAIECRVLEADRTIGVARGEFEVLDRGRFFDQEAFRIKDPAGSQSRPTPPAEPNVYVSDPEYVKIRNEALGSARCADRTAPVAISIPNPQYPAALLPQHIQGEVRIEGIILVDGTVKYGRVVKADHPEFGNASLQVLERYRFRPATCAGHPVPRVVTFEHTFKLQ